MPVAESYLLVWNNVLDSFKASEIWSDQIKTYLNNSTVEHLDSNSLVLSFPNALTKEFIDSSGIINHIKLAFRDNVGYDITIITIVSSKQTMVNPSFSEIPVSSQRSFPTDNYTLKYTFESFAVGESNQFAYGAALSVAELPAGQLNPLFIYGRSGLGKTHLLCAIRNYLALVQPKKKVLYFPTKELYDDITKMSLSKNWEVFDRKYTNADLLLIDDIQYLEGKKESIERVFQLLNEFTFNKKQIVLSADRSPHEIDMDERMISRFKAGLVADIQPPTFEIKLAILKKYRDTYAVNSSISDEVLTYIAEISNSNIREIEGALIKIDSYISLLHDSNMSVAKARDVLTDFFPEKNSKKISVQIIQKEVEKFFSVSHEEIIGSKRDRRISYARQMAMYLSKGLTEESYPSIGKKFGGRDHTTILHGVNQVEQKMKESREVYDQVEKLSLIIREKA